MSVNIPIVVIVAREFIEMTMFITTHVGAVVKNELMNDEDKQNSYRRAAFGVAMGVLLGAIISLSVGFGVKQATDDVEIGLEAGEGISKLIGFIFVAKMALKIPKWFGFSRFVEYKKIEKNVDGEGDEMSATDGTVLAGGKVPTDENESALVAKAPPKVDLSEDEDMANIGVSLFWNTLRESAECGCFTAIEVLVNPSAEKAVGASVGIGLGVAILVASVCLCGSNYMDMQYFGIFCASISHLLASGLATGATHAFEVRIRITPYYTTPRLNTPPDNSPRPRTMQI
jgi:high-affinity Fe2+/Pb2+ permease